MPKRLEFFIDNSGTLRHVHDDAVTSALSGLGPQTIARASHVDLYRDLSAAAREQLAKRGHVPSETSHEWFADLSPVRGGVHGPFPSRGAALDFELSWLSANRCPNASIFLQENPCQQLQHQPQIPAPSLPDSVPTSTALT